MRQTRHITEREDTLCAGCVRECQQQRGGQPSRQRKGRMRESERPHGSRQYCAAPRLYATFEHPSTQLAELAARNGKGKPRLFTTLLPCGLGLWD